MTADPILAVDEAGRMPRSAASAIGGRRSFAEPWPLSEPSDHPHPGGAAQG
jgi:hypothetical protein